MFVLTFPGHSSSPTIPALLWRYSFCPFKLYLGSTLGNKSGEHYYYYIRFKSFSLACTGLPPQSFQSALLFLFFVCALAFTVVQTPGDEAALLLFSIMNEGSFQPAHSSLLAAGDAKLSTPLSAHPAFMTLFCVHARIPREQ